MYVNHTLYLVKIYCLTEYIDMDLQKSQILSTKQYMYKYTLKIILKIKMWKYLVDMYIQYNNNDFL